MMVPAGRRGAPAAGAVLALVLAAGCAPVPPAAKSPGGPPPPAPAPASDDPSYDWHRLVILPFGSLLKDSPRPLHEVLLFSEQPPSGSADSADCYGVDGAPPRFVARVPEEYLLCFAHDRLARIEVSVSLAAADADFAHACARWLKGATPGAGSDSRCAGRDGGVDFDARLMHPPAAPAGLLSMTLSAAALPDAALTP